MNILNFFRSSQNIEIDHRIGTLDAVQKYLPRDLALIVLNYKGTHRIELQVHEIALKILDKVKWNYSLLAERKKRYLQSIPKTNLTLRFLWFDADLDFPNTPLDVKIAIASKLFNVQELIISSPDDLYVPSIKPDVLCKAIAKLAHLKKLHIYKCHLTDDQVIEIIDSCPELEDFKLTGGRQITDKALSSLGKLPRLRILHVSGDNLKFTGKGLPSCPQLRILSFGRDFSKHNQILEEFPLGEIISMNPLLEEFYIDGFCLTPQQISLVERLPHLKKFSLGDYLREEPLENAVKALQSKFPDRTCKYSSYWVYGHFN